MGKDLETAPQIRHARALRVKDVMTRDVVSVMLGSSLPAAAELMVKKRISGLPVVDAHGALVGIVTEADFLSAMNLSTPSLSDALETVVRKRRATKPMGTIVEDIMTKTPITIGEEDTLEDAVALMDRKKIKRLVVASGERGVAGIISRGDVVKLFAMK
jgi:CBS domain-containing protein